MKYLLLVPAVTIAIFAALFISRDAGSPASPVGTPVSYLAADGETFEAQYMSDDTVEVRFMPADGAYLKGFTAERGRSASGVLYTGTDGRFEFRGKGDEASIYLADGTLVVSGAQSDLVPETGQGGEVIYFDPQSRDWHDPSGPCHTCTVENGFGSDGQIEGALPVVWHDLHLTLKNDLGEHPPLDEVMGLFEQHYSANPARYGTHVALNGGAFRIIVATDHADTDFLSPSGALRAWYAVTEVEDR